MKVVYENDLAKGPGNGIFRCTEAAFSEGSYTFSLARASDHQFLGAEDWGTQRANLSPAAQALTNGELLLYVGTNVVNTLDTQENYRFFLNGHDGGSSSAGLQVRDVLYHTGSQTAAILQAEAEKPLPQAAPEPEPETPAVQPEPLAMPEMPPAEAPKPKSRMPLILLCIALLLLLIGGGAFLYFKKQETSPTETPPVETPKQEPAAAPKADQEKADAQQAEETKKEEEAAEREKQIRAEKEARQNAEKNKAEEKKAEESRQAEEAQQKIMAPGEQVAQFFNSKERTPALAAALSRQLPKATKDEQNAVYRLYYYASENGDTSVMVEYAACLDPSLPQWGDLDKDAPAAWSLYEKAKAARPEAATAQQNLKTWLDKEAASGNAQAREWLNALR